MQRQQRLAGNLQCIFQFQALWKPDPTQKDLCMSPLFATSPAHGANDITAIGNLCLRDLRCAIILAMLRHNNVLRSQASKHCTEESILTLHRG